MWLQAQDGNLVNLEHAVRLDVVHRRNAQSPYFLKALLRYDASPEDQDALCVIGSYKSETEAKFVLNRLWDALCNAPFRRTRASTAIRRFEQEYAYLQQEGKASEEVKEAFDQVQREGGSAEVRTS